MSLPEQIFGAIDPETWNQSLTFLSQPNFPTGSQLKTTWARCSVFDVLPCLIVLSHEHWLCHVAIMPNKNYHYDLLIISVSEFHKGVTLKIDGFVAFRRVWSSPLTIVQLILKSAFLWHERLNINERRVGRGIYFVISKNVLLSFQYEYSNKIGPILLISMHLHCFIVCCVKIAAIYVLLVCTIFGPQIWSGTFWQIFMTLWTSIMRSDYRYGWRLAPFNILVLVDY